jgi:DNA-binding protein HU-beta
MKEDKLINSLAARTSVSRELAEQMMNELIDIIIETVSEGENVKIDKFGTFQCKKGIERQGRNVKTGEILVIPSPHSVAFVAAKPFVNKLNRSGE